MGESIRTDPRNHAAEGDERIRTAVCAPGADPTYEPSRASESVSAKDAKFHQRPPLLAVDGDGYVWRVFEEGGETYWSMCPQDPSNRVSPEPITYYVPADVTDALCEKAEQYLETGRGDLDGAIERYRAVIAASRAEPSDG